MFLSLRARSRSNPGAAASFAAPLDLFSRSSPGDDAISISSISRLSLIAHGLDGDASVAVNIIKQNRKPLLGVGIPGMRARIEQLGGELDIRGDAGGTVVTASIPLRSSRRALAAVSQA